MYSYHIFRTEDLVCNKTQSFLSLTANVPVVPRSQGGGGGGGGVGGGGCIECMIL